jgi:hypothetical protein
MVYANLTCAAGCPCDISVRCMAPTDRPVVAVICDNVIIHRSKILQRWLQTRPRLGIRATP